MSDLFSLKGRVAVVTGASRGLGRDFAHTLAGAGAMVVCIARTKPELEATADLIRAADGTADAVMLDIKKQHGAEADSVGAAVAVMHGIGDLCAVAHVGDTGAFASYSTDLPAGAGTFPATLETLYPGRQQSPAQRRQQQRYRTDDDRHLRPGHPLGEMRAAQMVGDQRGFLRRTAQYPDPDLRRGGFAGVRGKVAPCLGPEIGPGDPMRGGTRQPGGDPGGGGVDRRTGPVVVVEDDAHRRRGMPSSGIAMVILNGRLRRATGAGNPGAWPSRRN